MKSKIYISILITFFSIFFTYSQEKFTISGTIADINSNETLLGVNIYFPDINAGAITGRVRWF